MDRRTLLQGLVAIAPGACIVTMPAHAASPDAELIRICAEHIVNLNTYDACGGHIDPEDDPLWAAYMATHDAILASRPQTLDGAIAKARAAKAEGESWTDSYPDNGPAISFSWDVVRDLLRLERAA